MRIRRLFLFSEKVCRLNFQESYISLNYMKGRLGDPVTVILKDVLKIQVVSLNLKAISVVIQDHQIQVANFEAQEHDSEHGNEQAKQARESNQVLT